MVQVYIAPPSVRCICDSGAPHAAVTSSIERPTHEPMEVSIEAQPTINTTASSIVVKYRATLVPRIVFNYCIEAT